MRQVIDLTLETPDDAVAGEPLRPRPEVIDLTVDDKDRVPVFGSAMPVRAGGSHAVAGEPRRPFKVHPNLKYFLLLNGYNDGEADAVMQKLGTDETKDLQYLSQAELGYKLQWKTTDEKFEWLYRQVIEYYKSAAQPIVHHEGLIDFLNANGLVGDQAKAISVALDIDWSHQLPDVSETVIQKLITGEIGKKLLCLRTFLADTHYAATLSDSD